MNQKVVWPVVLGIVLMGGGYFTFSLHQQLAASQDDNTSLQARLDNANAKLEKANSLPQPPQLMPPNYLPVPVQNSQQMPSALPSTNSQTALQMTSIDHSTFQAVHLSDKTVFFGKVSSIDTNFLVLTDIYYMQGGYQDTGTGTTSPSGSMSLVKRGNELAGTQDSMTINMSNVLFVENLKPDSQVMMAIHAYESSPH